MDQRDALSAQTPSGGPVRVATATEETHRLAALVERALEQQDEISRLAAASRISIEGPIPEDANKSRDGSGLVHSMTRLLDRQDQTLVDMRHVANHLEEATPF